MPQSYSEQINRRFPFEYVSLTHLRAEGVTAVAVPDARAKDLIRSASRRVNEITAQWFLPIESVERFSGGHGGLCYHPSLIPILKMNSVMTDRTGEVSSGLGFPSFSGNSLVTVPSNNYRVDDRNVVLITQVVQARAGRVSSRRSQWPRGIKNIVANGAFGWLENRPYTSTGPGEISTTTTAAITSASTSVTVADASAFGDRDAVIVRTGATGETFSTHLILTGTSSPDTLTFDAPSHLRADIALGATIISYGQVPLNVALATIIMVARFDDAVGSSAFVTGSVSDRIIKERTDNYAYELEKLASGGGTSETGNRDADRLLRNYHTPPMIFGV